MEALGLIVRMLEVLELRNYEVVNEGELGGGIHGAFKGLFSR